MEYAAGVVLLRAQSAYALDPETGACRWSVDAGCCCPIASVCGGLVMEGTRGFLLDNAGVMHALDMSGID